MKKKLLTKVKKYSYNLGICSGRFQPLHILHVHVIATALKMCKHVVLLVSHRDVPQTLSNPFTYEQRLTMIRAVFGEQIKSGRLIVVPFENLPDGRPMEDWGEWIFDAARQATGKEPDIIFYGADKREMQWVKKDLMEYVTEHIVSEGIIVDGEKLCIHATQLRQCILDGDYDAFKKYTHPAVHGMYWGIKDQLRKVKNC